MPRQEIINAEQPVYGRIESDLRDRIRKGDWPAGTKIPGRAALARRYNVALLTMERAIAGLLTDGTLIANGGRGTFVASGTTGFSVELAGDDMPSFSNGRTSPFGSDTRVGGFKPLNRKIGMLVNCEPGGFFGHISIRRLERSLSDAGATTTFYNRAQPAAEPVSMRDAMKILLSAGLDGLVVLDEVPGLEEFIETVDGDGIPTVFISYSGSVRTPIAQVFYDQQHAGYQAARHLIQAGHRRLTFVAPYSAGWLDERILGACDAVRDAKLPPEAFQVYPTKPEGSLRKQSEAGYAAAQQAMAEGIPLSAVIAPNDPTALGIWRAVSEAGRAVGTDVDLIGFDDEPEARTMGLTTMSPPAEELGEEAARMIVAMLRGERAPLQVRLRSHLVVRSSTGSTSQCLV